MRGREGVHCSRLAGDRNSGGGLWAQLHEKRADSWAESVLASEEVFVELVPVYIASLDRYGGDCNFPADREAWSRYHSKVKNLELFLQFPTRRCAYGGTVLLETITTMMTLVEYNTMIILIY
jgi:hypothetical protein